MANPINDVSAGPPTFATSLPGGKTDGARDTGSRAGSLADLASDINHLVRESNAWRAKAEALSAALADTEHSRAVIESERNDLAKRLQNFEQRFANLEKENRRLDEDATTAARFYERHVKEEIERVSAEFQRQFLMQQLKSGQERDELVRRHAAEVESLKTDTVVSSQNSKLENDTLLKRISEQAAEMKRLQTEAKQRDAEAKRRETVAAKAAEALREEIRKTEQSRVVVERKLGEMVKQFMSAENNNTSLQTKMADLETLNRTLGERVFITSRKAEQSELTLKQAELAKRQTELDLQQLQNEVKRLQTSAAQDLATATRELATATQELNTLRNENARLRRTLPLTQLLAEKQSKIDVLQRERAQHNDKAVVSEIHKTISFIREERDGISELLRRG